MQLNMLKEYTILEAMSIKELIQEWPKYFDYKPKTCTNKGYLVGEIIYRIQELTYGGLTRKTIDQLESLAESKTVNERFFENSRLAIGTRLVREVKGVEHHVTVIKDGYEYQGVKYKSLSGIAFAITGTRWNGKVFFGLSKGKSRPYHKSRKLGQ